MAMHVGDIIRNLFGTPQQQQPLAPGQIPPQSPSIQTPPNTQTQQTQQTAPNGVIPQQPAAPQEPASPMAKFKDVWDPTPTEQTPPGQQPQVVTPEMLRDGAKKVDFLKLLDPETLAKISAGGDEAVKALQSALNQTAQTVYGQSTVVSKKLIDTAVEEAERRFAAQIPGIIKRQNLQEQSAENPAFRDPSIQPLIHAVQAQFAEKFPKASTKELQEMTTEYLQGAAGMIAGKPGASAGNSNTGPGKKTNEEDWDAWINIPTPSSNS